MAYTLVGARYIGTGTLPTPVVGYGAYDTVTGNVYESNTSSTAWTLIGNANQTNLGMLPLTGGTMTGAILGASGFAPVDSPLFTTTAKLSGVNIATVNDLSATQTVILNGIQPKITEAVSATTASITVKANIARGSGILTFASTTPQTIPLPTYPDGTTALQTDCVWGAFFVGSNVAGTWTDSWPCGRSDSNGDTSLIWSANPMTNRTFYAILQDHGGVIYTAVIGYFIIGVK